MLASGSSSAARQAIDGRQLLFQQRRARSRRNALAIGVRWRAASVCSVLSAAKRRRRQQVVLEILELARALHPDVAGAERVLQLGQHAQLVEASIQPVRREAPGFPSVCARKPSAHRPAPCAPGRAFSALSVSTAVEEIARCRRRFHRQRLQQRGV